MSYVVVVHCSIDTIFHTVFMLSIAINSAEHVCAIVIIKHKYMLMYNYKIFTNIMLCLYNSTGHICVSINYKFIVDLLTYDGL